nr:hypothetical protein 2 [Pseudomonadaceae bacterium]
MPNKVKRWAEELAIAEDLVRRVCDLGSGRAEDDCLRNYPRDRYFIGSLRPVAPDDREDSGENDNSEACGEDASEETVQSADDSPRSVSPFLSELRQKLAPVAFGADYLVAPEQNESRLLIELRWAVYYRVFPAREDQVSWQQLEGGRSVRLTSSTRGKTQDVRQSTELDADHPSNYASADNAQAQSGPASRRRARTEDMCPRFRKIACAAKGEIQICRSDDGSWHVNSSPLQTAMEAEIARAQHAAAQDSDRFRTGGSVEDRVRVPEDRLVDDTTYRNFVASLRTEIRPIWRWRIDVLPRLADVGGDWVISVQFSNRSPVPSDLLNVEQFFFDTGAKCKFLQGIPRPFDLAIVPRGFRYDRRMWGRGFNCAIRKLGPDDDCWFETTHTPVYRQMRYQTRTDPPAKFADLAVDPIPVLRRIHARMHSYSQRWEQAREGYRKSQLDWEQNYSQEFATDLHQFQDEIVRFQRGTQLIQNDSDIRRAFELTNETFRRSRGNDAEWRLFQVVFLVTQIPGLAALDPKYASHASERRKVDIVYFPTGGGKTEAYLGTIVFHCFYDRLRGKRGGVTAWTRFPLRLLTLQQTQRAADVIGLAELVRRQQSDVRLNGPGVDGFGVGYFVGEGGSPNEITPPSNHGFAGPSPVWSQVNDSNVRQQWKRVVQCPACKTDTIVIDFDPKTIRLMHRCTNAACQFPNGVIPVYVVDNEIYRYLPSLVVGTIDKLAGLGNQRKMSMLFGSVDGTCPQHGYLKLICCQKQCSARGQWKHNVGNEVSGVTLFVQDELHLLKEGLGTFDSHYETFAQRLRQEFGHDDDLKLIASSATIEAFDRQVEHLYGRERGDARRFPGPGPTQSESFYAETLDYPQRLFVGVIPHNKTILNAILELIEYYHREALRLERTGDGSPNPYGGATQPGSPEYRSMIDLYRTSLTYFLANRQLNEVRTDVDGDINGSLRADGLPELNALEMTGNTSTDEVARNLAHLERPANAGQPPDAVLATSMVSHGVDVDRFNAMFFYGMPRLNAEYIQASSRVGRAHVGIVFDCFHPIRERDQSHYSYFEKFHEYLGQLVEPVAINRWSRFSVQRTVPGLFMGVLLQVVANRVQQGNPNRYYMRDHVLQQIVSQALAADDFAPILQEAYRVLDATDPTLAVFTNEIAQQVDAFLFDQIAGSGATATFVSEVLNPAPMRSLRDVDEPVEIELDSYGTDWANRAARR